MYDCHKTLIFMLVFKQQLDGVWPFLEALNRRKWVQEGLLFITVTLLYTIQPCCRCLSGWRSTANAGSKGITNGSTTFGPCTDPVWSCVDWWRDVWLTHVQNDCSCIKISSNSHIFLLTFWKALNYPPATDILKEVFIWSIFVCRGFLRQLLSEYLTSCKPSWCH